ncbi:Acetyl xylan esterase (AXE1) [Novipirellula galeiformis]|uniref:Acetyl xylan esterase (AXE1) n=1 Tax=Novipirellula galeiformis TaxID=2528004 RepID=A0A5C6CI29_9BACT|nr:Acetyl xylan esterase (AXE1) [Novipirellula galeiformis]
MRLSQTTVRLALLISAVIVSSPLALAAEPDPWKVYPDGLPDGANALRYNIDANVEISRQHIDPAGKQDWENAKESLAVDLREAIGLLPWPEKTPLNVQVTGRSERDGYTIENIAFQSFPGFYVTANLYVPKGIEGPMPAIVVTAGHSMEDGKNYDLYRTAQLGLVREGYVVLAYDPVGQGERKLPGNAHTVSYPAMLVGHTNLRYMLWDSIRSLDYLETRSDVDPKRIGIAGNSGGGLNTMYAMPVESRFAAGASFCCLCSYEAWIKDGGDHCICNHLPGIARNMEQFQFVGLAAPRPFMAGNGQKDPIFPIAGTRDTIRRAQQIYGLYDSADRVALHDVPAGHGWSKPLREAGYGWFNRFLQGRGDGSPVAEPEIALEPKESKDLLVFKDGKLPADAKSYIELVREEANRLVQGYQSVPSDSAGYAAWSKNLRKQLWETLGGKPVAVNSTPEEHGVFAWEGHSVKRLSIQTERNLEVPALLVQPESATGPLPLVIVLDAGGKKAAMESATVRRLLEQPIAVLALDVRALGEGKVKANQCASDAIVLGRPLLAQQAWDVIVAARTLSGQDDFGKVAVYGRGSAGLIAMLATALSDEIDAVVTEWTIASFVEAIADPLPQPMWAYAPNILKVADVSQLSALCAPRPLLWASPVDGKGKGMPEASSKQLFEPVLAGYQATAAKAAPQLIVGKDGEQVAGDFLIKTLAQ